MTRQRNLLATAIGALCAGVLYYAFSRQSEHVYFLSHWLPPFSLSADFIVPFGDYLPTFIHVYAFILLTVVVAAPCGPRILYVCFGWFILDSLLEVAQKDPIAHWIALHTPHWFSGIPFLENTANYFLFGTFDVLDLLSIAAGTTAAYLTAHITQGGLQYEKPT